MDLQSVGLSLYLALGEALSILARVGNNASVDI